MLAANRVDEGMPVGVKGRISDRLPYLTPTRLHDDLVLDLDLWVPRTPFGLSPELDPGPARIPRAPRESVLSAPTVLVSRARRYQTASSLAWWMGSPPRRVSVGFEERPATQRFCTRAASRRAGRDGGGDRAAA